MPPCALFCIQESYSHWRKLDTWGDFMQTHPAQFLDSAQWLCPLEIVNYSALAPVCAAPKLAYNVSADQTVTQSTDMRLTVWALVWDLSIVSPKAVRCSLSPTWRVRGRTESCRVIFLDPLTVAVQSVVSQWLNHLLVFEWISWGEPLSKAGWIWSLRGTPNE